MGNEQSIFTPTSRKILVFMVALVGHFLFFAIFLSLQGINTFWTGPQDARAYTTIAKRLIEQGAYINMAGTMPESWYTPGYPFFLAILYRIFDSWVPIVIIQNIVAALSAVIIYHIGTKYFTEGIGFVAALIFALEPTNAYLSNFLWSESIFLFLFLLSYYFFTKYLFAHDTSTIVKNAMLSGLFLAGAVYIRQVVLFLPLFLFLTLISARVFLKFPLSKTHIAGFLIFLLIIIGLIIPWSLRNKRLFDTYSIGGNASIMLYFYDALPFSYMRNAHSSFAYMIGAEEVTEPEGNLVPLRLSSEYHYTGEGGLSKEKLLVAHAKEIILAHPFQYAAFHMASGFGGIFLQDTWRSILHRLRFNPDISGLSRALIAFDLKTTFKQLDLKSFAWLAVGVIGHIIFLALAILSIIGVIQFLKNQDIQTRVVGFLCIAIVFYFIAVTGPAAYRERYRYPTTPFIFLLAAGAIQLLGPKAKDFFYGFKGVGKDAKKNKKDR